MARKLSEEQRERLAEKNHKYWADREDEALKHYIKDEKEYDRQIEKIYRDTLDSVQKEIDGFYGRYAKKEGISINEAKKRVTEADIKAYERKAKRYVRDKDFSKQANEEMRLYNLTMKVNRLEMLKANIGLDLIKGHDELEKYMAEILQGRTIEELERQAGILGKTITINSKMAHAIPSSSFHNAKFSDRIWAHQDLLKADLSKLLQTGLIQGKNPRVLARELESKFNTSRYNAERLMRTELARVQTEVQKASLERNGFTQFEFLANSKCCDICQEKHKKIFKMDKFAYGDNAPPLHPHCRCAIAPFEDTTEFDAWLDHVGSGGGTTWADWNKPKAEKTTKTRTKKQAASKVDINDVIERANNMGVKYAQLDKMPVDQAANLVDAVATLPEDCRPVFIGNGKDTSTIIGRPLGRKANQWYGVTYDYRDFSLRTMQLGYEKTDYDGGLLVGVNTSGFKTFDSLEKSKKVEQEKYFNKTGRKWFFNTDGRATAYHEMGHCYANVKGIPQGFESDAVKWAKESQCDMLTKTEEAWAEAWAAYHIGNTDLPDYIAKYIEKAANK